MYEVLDKSPVYYKGTRHFQGEFIDAPDSQMAGLVISGIVRKVEVPSAVLPEKPASAVEQTPLATAEKPPVEVAEKAKPVKKPPASRKASD
jgi:hypothetical protein